MKAQTLSKNHPETEPAGGRIQAIRLCAYELYQRRGGAPGHELEDWLEAERIVCRRTERQRSKADGA